MTAALNALPLRAAANAVVITPSDTAVFAQPTRGLYIGSAGNITVRMAGSQNNVLFTAPPVGSLLPISVDQVLTTGTTITAIW